MTEVGYLSEIRSCGCSSRGACWVRSRQLSVSGFEVGSGVGDIQEVRENQGHIVSSVYLESLIVNRDVEVTFNFILCQYLHK
jgi:hypothetical protein